MDGSSKVVVIVRKFRELNELRKEIVETFEKDKLQRTRSEFYFTLKAPTERNNQHRNLFSPSLRIGKLLKLQRSEIISTGQSPVFECE